MQEITYFEDIRERLGVTETQIDMMIYSGGLPPPNQAHCWLTAQIEPYLQNWEDKIKRRQPKDNKNIVTGNCTFPRHQR